MSGKEKICHYFQRGACKYGNNCRNLHEKGNQNEHFASTSSRKPPSQKPPGQKLPGQNPPGQNPPLIRPKKKYYAKYNEHFSNHTFEMMNRIEEEVEIRKKHLFLDPLKYMQEMIRIGALDKVDSQFTYDNDIYEKGVDYSSNNDDDKIMCSNKWIKPIACKPWTLRDIQNIVIVELKEESLSYCTQPSRLKHILKNSETLKDLKENPRFNLEKKLIALKMDDAEKVSKLLKINYLINERQVEVNRARAKGQTHRMLDDYWSEDEFFVYHVVFPVDCFQPTKSITESERWWEDKNKYVNIHIVDSENKDKYEKKRVEIKFQNDQAVEDTELHSIAEWSRHLKTPSKYFCGLCNTCAAEPSNLENSTCKKLLVCSSCQIVSYCSKECQKEDWNLHKKTCKDIGVNRNFLGTKFFPGMNVFESGHALIKSMNKEKDKKLFFSYLRFRCRPMDWIGANRYGGIAIDQYVNGNYEEPKDKIRYKELKYPKICNVCFEGGREKLTICDCRCVAYCSEKHQEEDVKHKNLCKNFHSIAREYTFCRNNLVTELPMPETETQVENLMEFFDNPKLYPVPEQYMDDPWLDVKQDLLSEHLSVPLTILYVMKEIMCYTDTEKFIGNHVSKENTLTLHILCAQPLIDPGSWELLLHQLKGVKKLHLVFCNNGVSHDYGRGYNRTADINDCVNHLNTSKKLARCSQCQEKNRLVTYHIYNASYYYYYRQEDSMKPDIVFASGCRNLSDQAMESDDENDDDEETYDGIPYSQLLRIKSCPLILAEESKEGMMNLVDEFSRNFRCQELMSLRKNPFAGFSRERRVIDKIQKDVSPIINERDWIACIRRKT